MIPKIYRPILVALIVLLGIQDIQSSRYFLGTFTLILGGFLGLVYAFAKEKENDEK